MYVICYARTLFLVLAALCFLFSSDQIQTPLWWKRKGLGSTKRKMFAYFQRRVIVRHIVFCAKKFNQYLNKLNKKEKILAFAFIERSPHFLKFFFDRQYLIWFVKWISSVAFLYSTFLFGFDRKPSKHARHERYIQQSSDIQIQKFLGLSNFLDSSLWNS